MNDAGSKIKYFRQRSKKSQLELELEIGMSTGSLSRIENGTINPTKETLTKVVHSLALRPSEIAYLLDLHIFSMYELTDAVKKISSCMDLEATLQTIVDIIFDLYPNYNGGFILLADKEMKYLNLKTISKSLNIDLAHKILGVDPQDIKMDITDKLNLCVKSYSNGRSYQTFNANEIVGNSLNKVLACLAAKSMGFESGLVVPLQNKDVIIGCILYTKRVRQEFNEEEVKMLELLNREIVEILVKRMH